MLPFKGAQVVKARVKFEGWKYCCRYKHGNMPLEGIINGGAVRTDLESSDYLVAVQHFNPAMEHLVKPLVGQRFLRDNLDNPNAFGQLPLVL